MQIERRDYWQPTDGGGTQRIAIGVAAELEGEEVAICDTHLIEAGAKILRHMADFSDVILDLENVKLSRLDETHVLMMAKALYSR